MNDIPFKSRRIRLDELAKLYYEHESQYQLRKKEIETIIKNEINISMATFHTYCHLKKLRPT